MHEKDKNKSVEEMLEEAEKEILQEDMKSDREHYSHAPGSGNDYEVFEEDFVEEPKHPNEIKHFEDVEFKTHGYNTDMNEKLSSNNYHGYNIDMGEKISKDIYSEDFIEDSLKIPMDIEQTKLIPGELKQELKDLAYLLKICDRYITKNGDRVISSFRDGVEMLHTQYEEAMSHLHQATYKSDIIVGDFIQDNALRTWHFKQFKNSIKPLFEETLSFLDNSEIGKKILDIL